MRLMLVDDHVVFREGLRALLARDPRFEVVAEAGSARESYVALESQRPDVAVVDIALPGTNGIAATREMIRRQTGCRVLMLSAHNVDAFVAQSFGAGALGYAIKSQPIEEIMAAIFRVARGEKYLPPGVGSDVIHQGQAYRRAGGTGPLAVLSVREREIFDLIVSGSSNQEMAKELCISVKTVDTHRSRINRKLGLHSTADVIRFAAVNGLISA
jgi:DNA-binding NarL/FixJ family response regulator